jgi:hypothetical protein
VRGAALIAACCLSIVLAWPKEAGASERGRVLLQRQPGTSGGAVTQVPHMRLLPGDAPICLDVAWGPATGMASAEPSLEELGLEVHIADWNSHQEDRFSALGLSSDGFRPLSEVPYVTATWLPPGRSTRTMLLPEAAPGETWIKGQLCLAAVENASGEWWIRVSAPTSSRDTANGPRAWSESYHLAFGRDLQPDTVWHAEELRMRAIRLGLPEEQAFLAQRLAELTGDDRWFGVRGDVLTDLGRHAEALADYRRAVKACEVNPDNDVEGDSKCRRYERIVAGTPPERMPRRVDGTVLERRRRLGR